MLKIKKLECMSLLTSEFKVNTKYLWLWNMATYPSSFFETYHNIFIYCHWWVSCKLLLYVCGCETLWQLTALIFQVEKFEVFRLLAWTSEFQFNIMSLCLWNQMTTSNSYFTSCAIIVYAKTIKYIDISTINNITVWKKLSSHKFCYCWYRQASS